MMAMLGTIAPTTQLPWVHEDSCPATISLHGGRLRVSIPPCFWVTMLTLLKLNPVFETRSMIAYTLSKVVHQRSFMVLTWFVDHLVHPFWCQRPSSSSTLGSHPTSCFLAFRLRAFFFCIMADDELSSGSNKEEHNIWNEVLDMCFHFSIGPLFQALLTEDELEKVALSCHFALDILCNKSCLRCPCVMWRAVSIHHEVLRGMPGAPLFLTVSSLPFNVGFGVKLRCQASVRVACVQGQAGSTGGTKTPSASTVPSWKRLRFSYCCARSSSSGSWHFHSWAAPVFSSWSHVSSHVTQHRARVVSCKKCYQL